MLSLLFTLPGTPVMFYGDELGMGENLAAKGRLAVRTPMQWTAGRNGGFSTAPADRPRVGRWCAATSGPKNVNARDQRPDPESLHAYVRALIRVYRECPELGWGTFSLLACEAPSVLAHQCVWEDRTLVVLHNLADARGHRVGAAALRPRAGRAGRAAGHPHRDERQGGPGDREARPLRLAVAAADRRTSL